MLNKVKNDGEIVSLNKKNCTYSLDLTYKFPEAATQGNWQVDKNVLTHCPEDAVYAEWMKKNNETTPSTLDRCQGTEKRCISVFILSQKVLPSAINFSFTYLYISVVYVIAKLFRTGLVPITAMIYIYDALNPDDLLMLIETINLYRLKGRLVEEEELYYLLIDVMRSPQVLKAICGDSIKTKEMQDKQLMEKETKQRGKKWLK